MRVNGQLNCTRSLFFVPWIIIMLVFLYEWVIIWVIIMTWPRSLLIFLEWLHCINQYKDLPRLQIICFNVLQFSCPVSRSNFFSKLPINTRTSHLSHLGWTNHKIGPGGFACATRGGVAMRTLAIVFTIVQSFFLSFFFLLLLLLTHFGESPMCEIIFHPIFWHN